MRFITVVAERARARSAACGKANSQRTRLQSVLCGIPVSIKDNYWTRGDSHNSGLQDPFGFRSQKDSDVVAKLAHSAGRSCLARQTCTNSPMASRMRTLITAPARNPWDRRTRQRRLERRIGGGARDGDWIRRDWYGYGRLDSHSVRALRHVGLKPTFGLVSVEGVIPLARDSRSRRAHGAQRDGRMHHARGDRRRISAWRERGSIIVSCGRTGFANSGSVGRRNIFSSASIEKCSERWNQRQHVSSPSGRRLKRFRCLASSESVDPSTNIALAEATQYHESQRYFPQRAE